MWEIAIVIGIVGLTFLFIYISTILRQDYPELANLMLYLSFVLFPVSFIILKFIAEPNSTAIDNILVRLYIGSLWVMIFQLFWLIILFIIAIIRYFRKRGQELAS